MKKLRKQILSGIILAMLVFLAACNTSNESNSMGKDKGGNSSASTNTNNSSNTDYSQNNAKGRFIEEDYTVPQGVTAIVALKKQEDSSLRMLTDRQVYNSTDGGITWELDQSIDLSLFNEGDTHIYSGALDSDGNIFLNLRTMSGVDLVTQTVMISRTGESHNFNFQYLGETVLDSVEFMQNGDIIAFGSSENILVIDIASGEIKNDIPASSDTTRIAAHSIGDTIIVQTLDGVELYDTSGNLLDSDSVLSELLVLTSEEVTMGYTNSLMIPQDEGRGLYYCNKNGLYNYTFGGNISEILIEGALNSIGSPSYTLISMAAKDDNTYLIAYVDANANYKFKNYYYSEDANVTPGNQLKIYSLYDSQTLRQGINNFNSNNSDIYASLEIGIEENSAVTESDAIKTLNTNIMAGDGPDVLLMDKMSIQSYIDKGMLVDISNTINEVSKTDGLFENIAKAYEDNGEIYAAPTRFFVPLLVGDAENIGNISNLNSLAEQVTELKNQNPEMISILGMFDERLLEGLFDISASTWIQEDGTLDETKLKEYLEAAKSIQDTEAKSQVEMDEINGYGGISSYRVLSIIEERQKLVIGQFGGMNDLKVLSSVNNQIGTSYKIASGQAGNTFIPASIIGISAKSNNIEASKSFVKDYLSVNSQSIMMVLEGGFPVNRAAFDRICIDPDSDYELGIGITMANGEAKPFALIWPTEEEIAQFKKTIETLSTASVLDSIIKDTVVQEGARYLLGNNSLEDAVSNIMKQINLYLAE